MMEGNNNHPNNISLDISLKISQGYFYWRPDKEKGSKLFS